MKSKQVKKLLKVANKVYPDGLIERIRKGEEPVGDGLAAFIVNEIKETAEGKTPEEITDSVISALDRADGELNDVINALRGINQTRKKKLTNKKLKDFTVFWTRKGGKTYKAKTAEDAQEQYFYDPKSQDEEETTDIDVLKGKML